MPTNTNDPTPARSAPGLIHGTFPAMALNSSASKARSMQLRPGHRLLQTDTPFSVKLRSTTYRAIISALPPQAALDRNLIRIPWISDPKIVPQPRHDP